MTQAGTMHYMSLRINAVLLLTRIFYMPISELCALWCAREGYDVADILHACDEEDEALEAEAKAGMGA